MCVHEREREVDVQHREKEDREMHTAAAAPTDAENKKHFIKRILKC